MSQMNYYYKSSEPTYQAHRKMMDDFNERYPSLTGLADVVLQPKMVTFADTVQTIFNGLDDSPTNKGIPKCPGAPLRKQSYTN